MIHAPKPPKKTNVLAKKLMSKSAHKDAKASKDIVADMEKDYSKKMPESKPMKKAMSVQDKPRKRAMGK